MVPNTSRLTALFTGVPVRTMLPKLMAEVAELAVPLIAEVGTGPNWGAAH